MVINVLDLQKLPEKYIRMFLMQKTIEGIYGTN